MRIKNKKNEQKKSIIQAKIDEIKLESHVDNVKKGKATNLLNEVKYRTSNLSLAINDTTKWAQQKHFFKQTKQYVDLLVDGVAVFLESIVTDKR